MVKFAHIADCHLGAFGRDPKLREYNLEAFEKAIEISIERNVDFIVIAGDLFHNPHPDMDVVNRAVQVLMRAREKNIRIYSVYGSHDFNIAHASLIDVLESAEVFRKVVNYLEGENKLTLQEDPSGVSIAGLSGRKNRADVSYFKRLDFSLPEKDEKSIFVFHTPIAELKPAEIHEERSVPVSSLPEGFDYYAGGHIHKKIVDEERSIYYPGPTFGASYTDLERNDRGFFIVDDWETEYVAFEEPKIVLKRIDADGLKVEELEERLKDLYEEEMEGDILLLKVKGTLAQGEPSNVDFNRLKRKLKERGFETVYLNRRELEGKELERVKVKEEEEGKMEQRLLEENIEEEWAHKFGADLLDILKVEKKEGETDSDYESRIWEEAWELIQRRDEYDKGEVKEIEKDADDKKSDEGREEKEQASRQKSDGQISLTDFGGEK
ncbi:MAG: metallophosphoesterase [Candidatus Thermoplasmatota archaeon]